MTFAKNITHFSPSGWIDDVYSDVGGFAVFFSFGFFISEWGLGVSIVRLSPFVASQKIVTIAILLVWLVICIGFILSWSLPSNYWKNLLFDNTPNTILLWSQVSLEHFLPYPVVY